MKEAGLLPQRVILQDWWQEVKENFWAEDAKPQVLKLVKELMESTMQIELTKYTGTEKYQRLDKPKPYRNGYYQRSLVTQFGTISDIKVPTLRNASFKTKVFTKYKRCQDIVEDLIEGIFLAGISTRRVGACISKLLDTKISHGTVSNITKRLDRKVQLFHKQSFIDEYQYLFLDAITLKIRYNGRYINRKALTAYGITIFGQRRLLDFVQAKGESAEVCLGLLNSLYERGIKGEKLKLITIDGSGGLRSGIDMQYPNIPIQRCWAHKLRNVSNYLKKIYQQDCIKDARKIYKAKSKHLALAEFNNFKRIWNKKAPKAVYCIEKDLEELLNFLDCPKKHRIRIRTTNVIERSFKEVRRRTRVFSCFSNRQSCERIIYAIFTHLNNQWKERLIKEFTEFS
jgi:putative transposase